MLAVGLVKGEKGARDFETTVPQVTMPTDVLVKVKEVGLDGTDFNILRYGLYDIGTGRDNMTLGHEMSGVVEEVGSAVRSLAPGDPVTVTVRRGCGQCHPCLHNQSDMCMTGLYTERGIHKLDGFLTRFVVDQEQYVVKLPRQLVSLAVLVEPLSIVEKGVEQIRIIQSRLPWSCPHPEHTFSSPDWGACRVGLVVGAGPLGILASALLRLAQLRTYVTDVVAEDNPKITLVKLVGARYVDGRGKTANDIISACGKDGSALDVIFEASGAAAIAVELVNYMSRSSIYIMTGIPRGDLMLQVDAAQLVRQMVRYNQVLVGSVNSNRRHFEMALRDLGEMEFRYPGMARGMLTHRFSLEDYRKAFDTAISDPNHVKTVIEVEPW